MSRRMQEGSVQYNEEAIQLALSRVTIKPCRACGHPVNEGYCCGHCGSGDGCMNTDESEIHYKALKSC